MAQARARKDPEISLFPFLSILVCLIGALVLLIVILTMVQSAMADGHSAEELKRAERAALLKVTLAAQKKESKSWDAEKAAAAKLAQELSAKQERFVVLRKNLSSSAAEKKKIQDTNAELQKQLENLLFQMEAINKEEPKIKAELERLKAEALAKQKPLDAKPRLVVQSSGAGVAGVSVLFFVECTGSNIVVYRPGLEPLRIVTGSIGADSQYDEFLGKAAKTQRSMVLFLVRPEGAYTYNRAAGWAESKFSARTAKLPLPGDGELDLSRFQIGGK